MWLRILVIVLIAGTLIGLLIYSQHQPPLDKVSGFLEAHEIRVGSRVGGRIAKINVLEGQPVKTGETLIELEPFDLKERLAEAQGKLGQSRQLLAKLEKGNRPEEISGAEARRDQLQANYDKLKEGPRKQELAEAQAFYDQSVQSLELVKRNYDRVKPAFEGGNASRDEMDRAANDLVSSEATVNVRRERLDVLKEGTRKQDLDAAAAQLAEAQAALALMEKGSRDEDVAAARAGVASQQAVVATFERQIAELSILAPANGTIEAVEIRPGDLLAPNAPALSMLDNSELWVRAYVPENRLNLAIGQKVRVTVDSFPGKTFAGEITFVGRQAEFTPGNVQTPEERSKQVFRIRVTMKEGMDVLRAGMSADVWLK